MSEPQRGEVWWVDLGLAGKVRPAVVMSAPIADDDFALLATIPHTTSAHPSRYAVRIQPPGMKDGFFNVQALAPAPRAKFMHRLAVLTSGQMAELDAAVKRWLCLD
ncbi:MAG: type II toxin-antitoxin system PemK/MazF family toxin [Chthoniobacteraceae bacterium]